MVQQVHVAKNHASGVQLPSKIWPLVVTYDKNKHLSGVVCAPAHDILTKALRGIALILLQYWRYIPQNPYFGIRMGVLKHKVQNINTCILSKLLYRLIPSSTQILQSDKATTLSWWSKHAYKYDDFLFFKWRPSTIVDLLYRITNASWLMATI